MEMREADAPAMWRPEDLAKRMKESLISICGEGFPYFLFFPVDWRATEGPLSNHDPVEQRKSITQAWEERIGGRAVP